MLHAQQRAENVGIEGGRVALGGLLRHRTGLAFGFIAGRRDEAGQKTLQQQDIQALTVRGSGWSIIELH